MSIKRIVVSVTTAAFAAGALATGAAVAVPKGVIHDMSNQAIGSSAVVDSATASKGTSSVIHDM